MLDQLTADDFTPHIGTSFTMLTASEPIAITLFHVQTAPKSRMPNTTRMPFSLLFRIPRDIVAEQGIYRLEHASMPALEIFLVPVMPDAQGPLLEAIFS